MTPILMPKLRHQFAVHFNAELHHQSANTHGRQHTSRGLETLSQQLIEITLPTQIMPQFVRHSEGLQEFHFSDPVIMTFEDDQMNKLNKTIELMLHPEVKTVNAVLSMIDGHENVHEVFVLSDLRLKKIDRASMAYGISSTERLSGKIISRDGHSVETVGHHRKVLDETQELELVASISTGVRTTVTKILTLLPTKIKHQMFFGTEGSELPKLGDLIVPMEF